MCVYWMYLCVLRHPITSKVHYSILTRQSSFDFCPSVRWYLLLLMDVGEHTVVISKYWTSLSKTNPERMKGMAQLKGSAAGQLAITVQHLHNKWELMANRVSQSCTELINDKLWFSMKEQTMTQTFNGHFGGVDTQTPELGCSITLISTRTRSSRE